MMALRLFTTGSHASGKHAWRVSLEISGVKGSRTQACKASYTTRCSKADKDMGLSAMVPARILSSDGGREASHAVSLALDLKNQKKHLWSFDTCQTST